MSVVLKAGFLGKFHAETVKTKLDLNSQHFIKVKVIVTFDVITKLSILIAQVK